MPWPALSHASLAATLLMYHYPVANSDAGRINDAAVDAVASGHVLKGPCSKPPHVHPNRAEYNESYDCYQYLVHAQQVPFGIHM